MPVYKNEKNGTWYVMTRYKDYTGANKQKCRRGFETKIEAQEWERQFRLQKKASIDMTLASFCEMYEKDVRPKLKANTWMTKQNVIQTKIIPYLGNRKLSEITAKNVIDWQNQMRGLIGKDGKPFSENYLRKIHAELSAIFNHAVRFYDLPSNPATKAGTMGGELSREMQFWTQDEYTQFAETIMDKPISYYAFEILYWCGLRCGELLALTPEDIDFEEKTIRINKSYQRINRQDVITLPKTKRSIRTIKIPDFLAEELKDCLDMYVDIGLNDRIFPFTKRFLHHEIERGCKLSGVKQIRVHDPRHSHVSLLIDRKYTTLAIGKRVGHTSYKITERYSHLFPSVQDEMAEDLNNLRKD